MSNDQYLLSLDERAALITEAQTFDDALGDDFEVACNAAPTDHVHVQRMGLVGETHSRIALHTHQGPMSAGVFIHPVQARALAAALLNLADELDGTVPLVFFPRSIAAESMDDPKGDV